MEQHGIAVILLRSECGARFLFYYCVQTSIYGLAHSLNMALNCFTIVRRKKHCSLNKIYMYKTVAQCTHRKYQTWTGLTLLSWKWWKKVNWNVTWAVTWTIMFNSFWAIVVALLACTNHGWESLFCHRATIFKTISNKIY